MKELDTLDLIAKIAVFSLLLIIAIITCSSLTIFHPARQVQSIHNDARKCMRHCHNAGLVVGSWDGAWPRPQTQHGCRCKEASE